MKKIIHRVQHLSKKAAEIKQAVHAMPGKAAELRQALTLSAGELHQVRAEVQSSLNGLRAHNEDRLLQAMREINDHTYTLEEAGYELTGMDLDLTLNQRLAVHLQRFEEVPQATLRALLSKAPCETIRSLLSGLLKAEETAANVELTHLHYDGVMVHIGAVPLIRMCWRSDTLAEQQQMLAAASQPAAAPPATSSPAFGSLFESRPTAPAPVSAPTPAAPASSPVASAATSTATAPTVEKPSAAAASPWSPASLERFKKMPDVSKYRH